MKQTTIEKLRQFVAGATEQQAFISEDAIALQGEILAAIDELLPKAEQELKEVYNAGVNSVYCSGHSWNDHTYEYDYDTKSEQSANDWFKNEYGEQTTKTK
jgi:hypothetical protein